MVQYLRHYCTYLPCEPCWSSQQRMTLILREQVASTQANSTNHLDDKHAVHSDCSQVLTVSRKQRKEHSTVFTLKD